MKEPATIGGLDCIDALKESALFGFPIGGLRTRYPAKLFLKAGFVFVSL